MRGARDDRGSLTLAAGPGLFSEVILTGLGLEPGIKAVGQACEERELEALVIARSPQVFLLDSEAIGSRWVEWISQIRSLEPRTRVLVLSAQVTPKTVRVALRSGAAGVFPKNSNLESFREAVRRVGRGEIWADGTVLGAVLQDVVHSPAGRAHDPDELTPREREISEAIAEGLRNKEIAKRLNVAEKTVKNQVHNIFRKLGVGSRFALALRILRRRTPPA
jgi:two-component system, NarL family, nitrate/nitrite response regulator NarL